MLERDHASYLLIDSVAVWVSEFLKTAAVISWLRKLKLYTSFQSPDMCLFTFWTSKMLEKGLASFFARQRISAGTLSELLKTAAAISWLRTSKLHK